MNTRFVVHASTVLALAAVACGSSSESIIPDLPYALNGLIGGSTGNFLSPDVMVERRVPLRTESGTSCPRRASNPGL